MSSPTLPLLNALRYGSLQPLPEPMLLNAWLFSCGFEEGQLRGLRYGEDVFLSRLFAVVQDKHGNAISPKVTIQEQTIAHDRFRLVFESVHEQEVDEETVHFVWTGTIEGSLDGTVIFEFDGIARTTFHRSRIGLCLLLSAAYAGHPVQIEHADSTKESAVLPGLVESAQPVLPFADIRSLTISLPHGGTVGIQMEGDIFGMEDQRNWTDASFNFCPPRALPDPVKIPVETRIQQRVILRFSGVRARVLEDEKMARREAEYVVLTAGEAGRLPEIGTIHSRPNPRRSLSKNAEKRLKALSLAHLRVDVRFTGEWRKNLAYVADTARRLEVPLAVALFLPADKGAREQALKTFSWDIRQAEVRIGSFLIYPEHEVYGGQPWPEIPAEPLKAIAPDAQIIVGSDSDFFFLNRFEGNVPAADGVTFQVNPQVNVFDNASVMGTPLSYEAVVETARFKSGNENIYISPITLKPRYNPYARKPEPPVVPPDPRQLSLFAAA